MSPTHLKLALRIAQDYSRTTESLKRLGYGIGGVVFLSADLRTAIKVLNTDEQFSAEVKSYQILARWRKTKIVGLTIPKMRDFETQRRIVRMDAVSPPFLLDFAGAHFKYPDFDSDKWAWWHRENEKHFGVNSWVAYRVYDELKKIGIYYTDFRPSNLKLEGLPGLLEPEPPRDNDYDNDF